MQLSGNPDQISMNAMLPGDLLYWISAVHVGAGVDRIASDLLFDDEDPEAVAQIVAESIRRISDYPGTFADSLAPHAASFGLRRGDGLALLRWLLGLVGDPETPRWLDEARGHVARAAEHLEAAVKRARARQPRAG